jgi:hypothetical protein
MKKIAVVGLVVLALIVGVAYVENARAYGPMMERGSWWQPATWNWGAYCPWNWGSRAANYPGYHRGYGWGGCLRNQGWGPRYQGYGYPSNPPQQSPQGR